MPKIIKSSRQPGNAKAGPSSLTKPTKNSVPPKLYSSFLPIPLTLPSPVQIISSSSSSKSTSTATHYIYARAHTSKPNESGTKHPDGRTLFVINLPVDCSERDLRVIFARWGVVEVVDLGDGRSGGEVLEKAVRGLPVESEDEDDSENEDGEEAWDNEDGEEKTEPTFQGHKEVILPRSKRPRRKPNTLPASVPDLIELPNLNPRSTPYGASGLRTAKIVYLDSVSVNRVLSSSHSSPITLPSAKDATENPSGLLYYINLHATLRPSLASIKSNADNSLARHDHLHSLLLSSRAKANGAGALVDEDGFTVVVRGGRYGRTGGRGDGFGKQGVAVAKKGFTGGDADKKKKARGAGELDDFYKFQKVDRKRQELANLRTKFEQDKAKVEEMKKTKRFKPY